MQVGWLIGNSSFAVSVEGTKKWLNSLLGQAIADVLDFQVRSPGIKCSQFGIETKTFALSASPDTSQATYQAITKILSSPSDQITLWDLLVIMHMPLLPHRTWRV